MHLSVDDPSTPRAPLGARIVGREALPALRESWTRLVAAMGRPSPFSSWEWHTAWSETLGRECDLTIVLVEEGARVVGILPFASGGAVARPRHRGRVLEFGAFARAHPDQLEPIAAPAEEAAVLRCALGALAHRGGFDCLRFPLASETAALPGRLASCGGGWQLRERVTSAAPYAVLSADFGQFLAGLRSHKAQKIRALARKLLAHEGVTYGLLAGRSTEESLAVLRRLHGARAQEKGIVSSFDEEGVQEFHLRFLALYPQEAVMFRGLCVAGEPFAVFYGFRAGGRVLYFQLGYDPEWSKSSPGLVLLSEVIRESCEAGCAEFDFLQGSEPYKRTWARTERRLLELQLFAPTLRGRVCCELDRVAGRLRDAMLVRRALSASGATGRGSR